LLAAITLLLTMTGVVAQGREPADHSDYLRALEEKAQAAGKKGSPEYYAVIREGLSKLAGAIAEAPQPTRSIGKRRMAAPSPRVEPSEANVGPLDADPRVHRAIEERRTAFRAKTRMMIGQRTEDENGVDRFKHAVALRRLQMGICSGVLVGRGAVLTAAHCVCDLQLDRPGAEIIFGVTLDSPTSFAVTPPARRFVSTSCPAEPGWDVALVFFATDGRQLPDPVPVAAPELLFQARSLYVAGFGATEHHTAGRKLAAEIPVISPICADAQDRRYGCVPGREAVLLDGVSGRDSCKGDSGGPAYLFNERYRLVAVTSRGLPGGANVDCDGRGGVYTLIGPDVVRWMIAQMIDRNATARAGVDH
jgi:Trypsin